MFFSGSQYDSSIFTSGFFAHSHDIQGKPGADVLALQFGHKQGAMGDNDRTRFLSLCRQGSRGSREIPSPMIFSFPFQQRSVGASEPSS